MLILCLSPNMTSPAALLLCWWNRRPLVLLLFQSWPLCCSPPCCIVPDWLIGLVFVCVLLSCLP